MSGKLIIFSAPSGSGKTTIVKHLIKNNGNLGFSISACTRPIREGKEIDGKDYYFLSRELFLDKVKKGEFVEWEEVYEGNLYGTLKEEIERLWDLGKVVIFDVDVVGGLRLKSYYQEQALAIFVKAPSIDVIKNRLIERGTENEESLNKRIDKVKKEMTFEQEFDEILLNDQIEQTLEKAQVLLDNFLSN